MYGGLLGVRAGDREGRLSRVPCVRGHAVQQEWSAGDRFEVFVGLGETHEEGPAIVGERHHAGHQPAAHQVVRGEAAPSPLILQLVEIIIGICYPDKVGRASARSELSDEQPLDAGDGEGDSKRSVGEGIYPSHFNAGEMPQSVDVLWGPPFRRRGVTADRLLGCFSGHTQFLCFLRCHDPLVLRNSSISSLATCVWTSVCNAWNFAIHLWS